MGSQTTTVLVGCVVLANLVFWGPAIYKQWVKGGKRPFINWFLANFAG
jgi:hypothetical protein